MARSYFPEASSTLIANIACAMANHIKAAGADGAREALELALKETGAKPVPGDLARTLKDSLFHVLEKHRGELASVAYGGVLCGGGNMASLALAVYPRDSGCKLYPIDRRERGAILAGLRYWQAAAPAGVKRLEEWQALCAIQSDGGEVEPLSTGELDALCERLNV